MSHRPAPTPSRQMLPLRTVIFWAHLVAGVTAGALILVMSVTGVLLTYERQLIAWSDRDYRSIPPKDVPRLPPGTLVGDLKQERPDLAPSAVTISADPTAPVTLAVGPRLLYVDAYSGRILGEGHTGVRRFMTAVRAWHRWLAVEGDGRVTARLFTGWATFIFLFIVMSGFCLWVPRRWTWQHTRTVVCFNRKLRGRARDFNWHNTVGAWSVVPLFVIVLSALPMSFPWANAALYRVAGDTPPIARGDRAGAPVPARSDGIERVEGPAPDEMNRLWGLAIAQEPDWKTMTARSPASSPAPLVFTIDRGNGGQPHLRSSLVLDATGRIVSRQAFGDLTRGARLRGVSRFAHTGEVLGVAGQTIAGLASGGASVLVGTGLALAIRRLSGALRRRGQHQARSAAAQTTAA